MTGTVTVEPEYAKLAGKEVIDLNFLAKSEETDRELAEADVAGNTIGSRTSTTSMA